MFIKTDKHPLLLTLDPLDLAKKLVKMRYDSLAEYIAELSFQLTTDSIKDREAGRIQLSDELHYAADHLREASDRIWDAWKICKPHMEKKNDNP